MGGGPSKKRKDKKKIYIYVCMIAYTHTHALFTIKVFKVMNSHQHIKIKH